MSNYETVRRFVLEADWPPSRRKVSLEDALSALDSLQQENERLRKAAREYLDLAAEALDLRYDDSYLTKPEEVNLGAAEAALRAALDSQEVKPHAGPSS